MPDQLQPIVQKMIDAGESEENIATVIQHFKGGPPPTTTAASASDMLTGQVGRETNLSDSPAEPNVMRDNLGGMLEGMAHPQSASDLAGLLIPSGVGAALDAGKAYYQTAKEALTEGSTVKQLPFRMLGKLKRAAFGTPEPGASAPGYPRAGTTPAPAQTLAADAAPIAQGMSDADRAGLVKQGMKPEAIAKLEAQLAGQPPPAMTGQLRMTPPAPPPMQVNEASLPDAWKATVRNNVGHALDPQRVDVGAAKTGQAVGMTKQQVRDVATPILGVEQGAASPILPEGALKKIVDTLKALPPGGPEREAYVARATSGKTQWQIENIRRTLEHLGLVVPAAAGGAMFHDALLKRLNASSTRETESP